MCSAPMAAMRAAPAAAAAISQMNSSGIMSGGGGGEDYIVNALRTLSLSHPRDQGLSLAEIQSALQQQGMQLTTAQLR